MGPFVGFPKHGRQLFGILSKGHAEVKRGYDESGAAYHLRLDSANLTMNRLRIVTRSFLAKCYAVVPPRIETIESGERVFYMRNEDGHALFARASDPEGKEPFIVDAATFEANSEFRSSRS